jgi:hypothetical protein
MNEPKVPQVDGVHNDAQRLETRTEQVKQLLVSLHSKYTTTKILCSIGCKVIFRIGQPSRYYS